MNNITSVKEKGNIDVIKNDEIVKLLGVPKLGSKLRKSIFTSGCNLQNLIRRNKSKLIHNSFPGVYHLDCTWSTLYIAASKREVITAQAQLNFDQKMMVDSLPKLCQPISSIAAGKKKESRQKLKKQKQTKEEKF